MQVLNNVRIEICANGRELHVTMPANQYGGRHHVSITDPGTVAEFKRIHNLILGGKNDD